MSETKLNITSEEATKLGFKFKKISENKLALIKYVGSEKDIIIPECVDGMVINTIGENAFKNCNNIKNITISKRVKIIKDHAFYNCSSLREIVIPDGVKTIEWRTFYGCSHLKSVEIPKTVKTIQKNAFDGCSKIENITIPSAIKKIDERVFHNCSSLKEVVLPEGVKEICGSAFANCSQLSYVYLPETVTKIGWSAFYGCGSLTEIIIPKGVLSIGENAFKNSGKLNIIFKNSILNIDFKEVFSDGEYVPIYAPYVSLNEFNGTKLKSCAVLGYINHISEYENMSDAYKTEYNKYIKSHKDVRNSAFEKAFEDEQIMHLIINEKMISLSETEDLIERASKNKNVAITAVLMEYKQTFFSDEEIQKHEDKKFEIKAPTVTELKKIWSIYKNEDGTLEISGYKGNETEITVLSTIGKDKVISIGNYAFSPEASRIKNKKEREQIKSVVIPEGVTSIEEGAFYNCSRLTNITIPEGVTSIQSKTFYGCSSLASITIPESVTSIEYEAFSGCSSLTSITIPEGVTSIGCDVFYGCSSLKSITIPESMTSIGETYFSSYSNAFISCNNLINFIVDDKNTVFSSDNGMLLKNNGTELVAYPSAKGDITISDYITSIGRYVFQNCSSLTSITISESVTSIGLGAFYNCSSLTSISIPESVTSIGLGTFENCSSLTSISIPESVTSIGEDAFWGCSRLTSITIPESVTSIGKGAFWGCSNLASISIPESVTSIEYEAFSGCSSLKSITIPESVTSINSYSFSGCNNLVITAHIGSYAEEYAKAHKIPFKAIN